MSSAARKIERSFIAVNLTATWTRSDVLLLKAQSVEKSREIFFATRIVLGSEPNGGAHGPVSAADFFSNASASRQRTSACQPLVPIASEELTLARVGHLCQNPIRFDQQRLGFVDLAQPALRAWRARRTVWHHGGGRRRWADSVPSTSRPPRIGQHGSQPVP